MSQNRYFLQAHLLPALLTAIPALIFFNTLMSPELKLFFMELPLLLKGTGLTFSVALVFLWVQLNKLSGRIIFQKLIFKGELYMPTTNYLLYKSSYFTPEIKRLIRLRIEALFSLRLYNQKKERKDEINARKQICIAVSQIRELLRNNQMLLRHNIDYGFFKNLLSGCLPAFLLSGIGFLAAEYLPELLPFKGTFAALTLIYLLPLLFCRSILRHFGHYYSKILYEQFLLSHSNMAERNASPVTSS